MGGLDQSERAKHFFPREAYCLTNPPHTDRTVLGRTAVSVAGGCYHTCALLDDATLKCWGGKNSTGLNHGQLGQGNTFDLGQSEGQMGDALPAIDLGTNRTVLDFAPGWYHT